MFYIVFNFAMAVIMFLFGIWFYRSKGQASNFLSGYNMKSAEERKKYDENAMCKAYGKRMMFMSIPFIAGMIIDIWYILVSCKWKRGRDMDTKKIGAFLKQCRKEKNLTQEQLAEKFGVSARTVSRWETGVSQTKGY